MGDKRKNNVGARACVCVYYCCCRRIAQQLPDGEINNNWDVPDTTVTVYNPIADFYPFSPLSSALRTEKYDITCVLRDLRFSGIENNEIIIIVVDCSCSTLSHKKKIVL